MIALSKCKRCVFQLNMTGLEQRIACGYLYYTGEMRPGYDECPVYLPYQKNRELRKKLCDRVKKVGIKPLGRSEIINSYIAERIEKERRDFNNEH